MEYPNRPPRYPAHIPVVVSQGGRAQSGFIVDINAYGACLSGVDDLSPDDTIRMRGAIETNTASVRWAHNRRVGVYFDQPVDPQYLAMLRLRSQSYRSAHPVQALHNI